MKMTQVIEPKKNSMNTIIACEQVFFCWSWITIVFKIKILCGCYLYESSIKLVEPVILHPIESWIMLKWQNLRI